MRMEPTGSRDSFLDAIEGHAALLDSEGRIIAVNQAWIRFGEKNGLAWKEHGLGENYVEISEQSMLEGDASAGVAARAIRSVLKGERPFFEHEYVCEGPDAKHWYCMLVTRIASNGAPLVIVRHEDVTEGRDARTDQQRMIASVERMGSLILENTEPEEILLEFSRQVFFRGWFRSITVSLVDTSEKTVKVLYGLKTGPDGGWVSDSRVDGLTYELDESNIMAEVARTGKTQIVSSFDDDRLDRRIDDQPGPWEEKVAYFVPIRFGDTVTGIMATASHPSDQETTLRRLASLEPLLGQVGVALHHASIFAEKQATIRESEERGRLIESVSRIGAQVLDDLDGTVILDRFSDIVVSESLFRSASMWLVDRQANQVHGVATRYENRKKHGMEVNVEWGMSTYSLDSHDVVALAVRENKLQIVDDPEDPRLTRPVLKWNSKVAYYVPISHGGRVYAVFATASERHERQATLERIKAVHPLLSQIAVALHHALILREREEDHRLIQAILDVGSQILEDLDQDAILHRLGDLMVSSGLFRSASLALVDDQRECLRNVVAQYRGLDGKWQTDPERSGNEISFDSHDAMAVTYRENATQIIDTPGDSRIDPRYDWSSDKVAYFVPISYEGRVFAVYATASTEVDRERTIHRIEASRPLFSQVAIALHHARVHQDSVNTQKRLQAREDELKEREALFRLVFETSPLPIVLLNESGTILLANPASERYLGYEHEELNGVNVTRVVTPGEREEVLAKVRCRVRSGSRTDCRDAVCKEGRETSLGGGPHRRSLVRARRIGFSHCDRSGSFGTKTVGRRENPPPKGQRFCPAIGWGKSQSQQPAYQCVGSSADA